MLSDKSKFPMPIITPRLILRPPFCHHDDIHEYYNAVTESMNELTVWMPWAKSYPTIPQVEEYLRDCTNNWITKSNNYIGLPLLLIEKESKKMVGNIVMWNIVWEIPKFELGFWARTSETKKGYIREAVNALSSYSFSTLGVKRIEIKCEAENIRAKNVPEHLGFKLEKVLPKNTPAVSDGELVDVWVYSLENVEDLSPL